MLSIRAPPSEGRESPKLGSTGDLGLTKILMAEQDGSPPQVLKSEHTLGGMFTARLAESTSVGFGLDSWQLGRSPGCPGHWGGVLAVQATAALSSTFKQLLVSASKLTAREEGRATLHLAEATAKYPLYRDTCVAERSQERAQECCTAEVQSLNTCHKQPDN